MFLSLICGSPVVHSVIVKRRAYITLRDGWVSVQLTFLLSLSSPLSIQHHHPLSASFSQFRAVCIFKCLQPRAMCCEGCGGESIPPSPHARWMPQGLSNGSTFEKKMFRSSLFPEFEGYRDLALKSASRPPFF